MEESNSNHLEEQDSSVCSIPEMTKNESSDSQSLCGLPPSSLDSSPVHQVAEIVSNNSDRVSPSVRPENLHEVNQPHEMFHSKPFTLPIPTVPQPPLKRSVDLGTPVAILSLDEKISATSHNKILSSHAEESVGTSNQSSPTTASAASSSSLKLVRDWGFSTLKLTKQVLQEKLKLVSRTMDPLLENKIDTIREDQLRYQQIIETTQRFIDGLEQSFQAQSLLGDMFLYMGHKHPDLVQEFTYNSHAQKVVATNGQRLIVALKAFTNDIRTLSDKSTTDYLETVRKYELARSEYDMYRLELESLQAISSKVSAAKIKDCEDRKSSASHKYEQLKNDVECKGQLLEENRNRVLQKALLLFHNSIASFFSGNQASLDVTLRQFSIRGSINHENSTITTDTTAEFINAASATQ